ncbi:MAG: di-trans,poly-cis-decaprenylcistransferase [Proteobacteria bacterium]|nr:di-trans,poly-cis-decaprenylcistransferase [Pseudomonadota bacterium]
MQVVQNESLPGHVAVIMDGNGRWARARGYPRFYGHIRGAARVKEIVRASRERGIRALTLYAFSTENWRRPDEELQVLWKILRKYLRREVAELKRQGIRLHVMGEYERLPPDAVRELKQAIEELSGGDRMHLTFALSYGARSEIVRAVRTIAEQVRHGRMDPQEIAEDTVSANLWTSELDQRGDVDLLIRTSGEQRLSNFMLWQCSYAEFDFPVVQWPDYTVEEFMKSLEVFGTRKRRFGSI